MGVGLCVPTGSAKSEIRADVSGGDGGRQRGGMPRETGLGGLYQVVPGPSKAPAGSCSCC